MGAEYRRRTRWALAVFLPVFLIVELATLSSGVKYGFTVNTLGNLALLPTLALFIGGLGWFQVRRAARRLAESPELGGEGVSFTFDDQRIVIRSALSFGESAWEALYGARETKDAFLLYRSKEIFHFVVKRTLRSPDDVTALRELIRSKLGDKAKLL